MPQITNYRDISPPASDLRAGFQFEFFCESCGDIWKTPFKPYRSGQAAGLFRRFSFVLGEFYKVGAITDMVAKIGRASGTSVEASGSKAKVEALGEALELARQRYDRCTGCQTMVCGNCYDESTRRCNKCDANAGQAAQYESASTAAATVVCPNCQTPSQGGRFCHECGFDMASTHKSCPGCGATMSRQARFCTDCGHGF
jgi:hypothetical protein